MPEDIMVLDQAVNEAPRVLSQPHARSTYQIVSMVAYLLGVPKKIFEHDYEPPKLDIYERLDKNVMPGSFGICAFFARPLRTNSRLSTIV